MKKKNTLLLIALSLVVSTSLMAQAAAANNGKHQGQKIPLIDQQPQYPGGEAELTKFIQSQLVYPAKEKEAKHEGSVLVRFAVMEDGSVNEVNINKSVSPALDEEAIRVVKLLPKFAPGQQQGMSVKAYKVVPVEFKL